LAPLIRKKLYIGPPFYVEIVDQPPFLEKNCTSAPFLRKQLYIGPPFYVEIVDQPPFLENNCTSAPFLRKQLYIGPPFDVEIESEYLEPSGERKGPAGSFFRRNWVPDLSPVVISGDAGGSCVAMRAAEQRRTPAFIRPGSPENLR